jgi:hypothetical protein
MTMPYVGAQSVLSAFCPTFYDDSGPWPSRDRESRPVRDRVLGAHQITPENLDHLGLELGIEVALIGNGRPDRIGAPGVD